MHLHYGTPQVLVAIIYLAIVLVLVLVFATVAASTRSATPFPRVQAVGYWIRRRWLAFLAALLVVAVGSSWAALPYASGSGADRTVVKVTAGQFFWAFAPSRVPVGTRVRFEVVSRDVNHGFGLYDPHGHLIGSVQAMPGYHNKLDLTMSEPGVYRIRCLELCGLNHATMEGSFTVVRR